jgi:hypothetical protein
MREYNVKTEIVPAIKDIGGLVWTAPYYVNLAAIRDLSNPDSWNDTFIYFYWRKSGELVYTQVNEFTTDPGVKCLETPQNSKGCAILADGFHRKLWRLGYHKGYEALQQYSSAKVYRDNNKDDVFDLDPATFDEGMFGINLHRANVNSVAEKVGGHSAGCFVFRKIYDFNKFLETIKFSQRNCSQRYYSVSVFDKSYFNK